MNNIDTPEGMEFAKKWLTNMVQMVKPGGIWGAPRSNTVYQLDRITKVATRLMGPGDNPTERVFRAIGWEVK